MKKTRLVAVFCFVLLAAVLLSGCTSFTKKFTRPKKEDVKDKPELVLAPEEYPREGLSRQELYQQHFIFWKAWHDELLANLREGGNRKKQLECLSEQIKNLADLKVLLTPEKQQRLEGYLGRLQGLKFSLEQDVYGMRLQSLRSQAQQIGQAIMREFSFKKVKDLLG